MSVDLRPFCELSEAWRSGIAKLKSDVKGSPSHDLHRMINERCEAFTICACELDALIDKLQKEVR
jgi:hypothetical protein